jgi:hypothetical protein
MTSDLQGAGRSVQRPGPATLPLLFPGPESPGQRETRQATGDGPRRVEPSKVTIA